MAPVHDRGIGGGVNATHRRVVCMQVLTEADVEAEKARRGEELPSGDRQRYRLLRWSRGLHAPRVFALPGGGDGNPWPVRRLPLDLLRWREPLRALRDQRGGLPSADGAGKRADGWRSRRRKDRPCSGSGRGVRIGSSSCPRAITGGSSLKRPMKRGFLDELDLVLVDRRRTRSPICRASSARAPSVVSRQLLGKRSTTSFSPLSHTAIDHSSICGASLIVTLGPKD